MKILCKVTSRERPKELLKCIKSYTDLALNNKNLIWLFSFDGNDEKYNNEQFINEIYKIVYEPNICFGVSTSKIDAINRDVEKVKDWDILVNISDDQLAVKKHWDKIIINSMPENLDASLWFNDGHQNRLNTMEILGLKYYERFNYIYQPDYKSFFCDNESHIVAEKLGKMIKFEECIIKHFHPAWNNSTHMVNDELYKRNNKFWNHDKTLFNERTILNYGL